MKLARALGLGLLGSMALAGAPRAEGMWVTAYYPAWRQARLSPEKIDFDAVTHLVHFGVVPRPDGTLDRAQNMMTPANVAAAVKAAHAAGKKILFTVGGQGTHAGFAGAIAPKRRRAFVSALAAFLTENGYDGIDLDMEEIAPADAANYAEFVRELRARLDAVKPRPLLTAAALWEPGLFGRLADQFDQINLMTYNLSGPYPGWVVWHSGAIYDGGRTFPNGRARLPSVDGLVESFIAAGVPRRKLGAGISFNGYVWSGGEVSRPRQSWRTPPSIRNVPYYELADKFGIREFDETSPGYHWDEEAQASYLSVPGKDPADAQFVSYQNEVFAARLVRYVRDKSLGGLIVWDLGAGYRAEQPAGRRDVLLQSLKQARRELKLGSL